MKTLVYCIHLDLTSITSNNTTLYSVQIVGSRT